MGPLMAGDLPGYFLIVGNKSDKYDGGLLTYNR